MSVLSASEVNVLYAGRGGRSVTALSNVNLTIQSGEFVVAVGASGCGKTTLLKLFAGFLEPTSGSITLGGKSVEGPGGDRGVVFQDDALTGNAGGFFQQDVGVVGVVEDVDEHDGVVGVVGAVDVLAVEGADGDVGIGADEDVDAFEGEVGAGVADDPGEEAVAAADVEDGGVLGEEAGEP